MAKKTSKAMKALKSIGKSADKGYKQTMKQLDTKKPRKRRK